MFADANHHVGLRVSDIERAARFYIEVFGGRWQTMPSIREGDDAALIMGTPNTRFLVCHVEIGNGVIELFQFLSPVHEMSPVPQPQGNLIHFGIHVDNARAALERLEKAGGRRLWPDFRKLNDEREVIYAADPDGNVIEIIEASAREVADILIARDPSVAPPAQG